MTGIKVYGDYKVRTVYNSDGFSTVSEYVERARHLGYTEIAIADTYYDVQREDKHFLSLIERMPTQIDGIRVLRGMETCILPSGSLTCLPDTLSKMDWVIATVKRDKDFRPDCNYTDILLKLISESRFNVKMVGALHTYADDEDVERIVQACKHHGVVLEVSNECLDNTTKQVFRILRICKANNAKIALTSAAQHHYDVGNFGYLPSLLEDISFPSELVHNYTDNSGSEIVNREPEETGSIRQGGFKLRKAKTIDDEEGIVLF